MGGIVREVQARALGRGAQLVGDGEKEWEMCLLLYAEDTVLVADSKKKLERLVEEFGRVCMRRKLKVDVVKSKVNYAICQRWYCRGVEYHKGGGSF